MDERAKQILGKRVEQTRRDLGISKVDFCVATGIGTADDFLDRYAALPSAARNSAGVRPPSASLRLSVL